MRHARELQSGIALIVLGAVLALAASAPAASAETLAPWWSITTGARPTSLKSGLAKDEVQELVVSATSGDFFLGEETFTESEQRHNFVERLLPFNATAEEVQKQLEVAYPGNKVEVSGDPGGPYTITFPNQRAQLVKAQSSPGLISTFECKELEEFGFGGVGSCGGEPTKHFTPLEGGAKEKPEVIQKIEGAPDGQLFVAAENLGDASTSGTVTVGDMLPKGLKAVAIEALAGGPGAFNRGPVKCSLTTLKCGFAEECREEELNISKCILPPFEQIEVRVAVVVESGAEAGLSVASVSGGGASAATASHRIQVGDPERFGIEDWQQIPENAGGSIDTQAGSHPFQLTSIVTLNSATPDSQGHPRTVSLPKNILAELTPGLIGNPTPFAQCSDAQFSVKVQVTEPHSEGTTPVNECPAASAIGVATVTVNEPNVLKFVNVAAPIFNMVPRGGEPARFGFKVGGIVPVFLDTSIRTGSDYGVTVSSIDTPQIAWLLSSKLTFWGVPGAREHDHQRGWDCLLELGGPGACPATNPTSPPPFIVMPTSCEAPFETTLRADSWAASGKPSETAEPVTYRLPQAVDGCNHLPFGPEIRVTPDGTAASSPTGLNVDVHVPQDTVLHAESLAESAVKQITVALPPGVAVNPSGGDGLQACTEGQVGYLPPPASQPPEQLHFTPTLPEAFCPNASKVGTVKITTPLLPKGQNVTGAVYLAAQNQNPFGSLIGMYIVAEDPVSGALVKLPGEVDLTETGQIVTTFRSTPQLAFEDAELHFFGGERAPLSTPAHCGAYTTSAKFTPWSGNDPVNATSTFNITSGPNGSPCPGASLPFNPSLTGGTTNINAGAFSALTTTIGRVDGQQNMQSVQLHMPPGLSGILSGVRLCPEAQANEGTCGPESLIGETTVSAGVGSDPVSVKGGRVYITEHYAGAPFGLSIVNPVKAGPFDLEHDTSNPAQQPACDCVVVRAQIEVDPHTAALTITTDPSGSHAIPHLIDGIPVQIQKVNVLVNRPGFTFNPTNCSPMSLTGSISSDEGASSPVSVPFQATNCAVLKFGPKFTVSTSGKTSKANGATLTTKLAEPPGALGTQANITKVKVELPKQLPSRLTTLQKACTSAQFDANPAGCPSASIIGHAKVITPLLPVPLTGPAYFVSHGGEAFPSLVIVLQGYGVTVDLVGTTFINKAGITSTTFKTVPDTPFNTFELTLPQGKFSALAANGNLCTSKLLMPSEFLAQNGALLKQNTPIVVTGCAKHKLTRAQKLKAALKACRKKHNKAKRAACRRQVHRRYGPIKKKKK
jgi:hypothetical protein